ncbi:hypothetical protein LTR16_011617, partial [Cryomyces antarcticus]
RHGSPPAAAPAQSAKATSCALWRAAEPPPSHCHTTTTRTKKPSRPRLRRTGTTRPAAQYPFRPPRTTSRTWRRALIAPD